MSPLRAPLTGRGVRGEPLGETHRDALRRACAEDLDIWQIYAVDYGPRAFDASFSALLAAPLVPFALFHEDGRLIGMSSFLNIEPERQLLEIGNSYYRPAFRGAGVNRPIKDMMLRHAFDHGFTRIEFRVDARNLRSQAAMAKLGAVREGVMRQDRTTWTGHRRDTVLYSILREEWTAPCPAA
ncbi:GNAT family N-acetyltransferase [Sphingomicrobium astaxanthinifaciens]|uniref:GNAT family N-acetyltransferase n=1 Tax=Sphingomicrobium astaxanthinifaciens TaxID=1227949 RepID=UPI001FCAC597|nr:GNAT family protein [Sphingomicrobium astaxanthinifaciens]MCJ7420708.1 GNAT family N-acetyltransferase [Sphingomicrobium astaxanthinifaciens]